MVIIIKTQNIYVYVIISNLARWMPSDDIIILKHCDSTRKEKNHS